MQSLPREDDGLWAGPSADDVPGLSIDGSASGLGPSGDDDYHGEPVSRSDRMNNYKYVAGGKMTTIHQLKKEALEDALLRTGWNKQAAADLLGISVRTVNNWIEVYGLSHSKGEGLDKTA